MSKTGLVVSAHPGDFVWRAGGAIALHAKRGYRVKIVCLAFGERGESQFAWKQPGITLEKVKAGRRDEAERAAAALGAEIEFFDAGDYPLRLTDARVELRDVSFAYRPNEPVLNRMSFVAEPGKVTALVGPSGGGKSTVLALLLRFYEVTDGDILIDGQAISKVSRNSLRHQTAYVGQDVYLFRDTVRANIAFGKPGASEDEIVAAAKAACAHDFIMGFPLGYDTPVGEHGTQLSGGQRQRIAVARALVKNAPVILLDEATAALDSESEQQVQEAIEHLCQNRTTIVIAHRLHTIMHADAILVVEGGEIVERGRHDELLRRGGRYASFFRLQQREAGPPSLAPISATA